MQAVLYTHQLEPITVVDIPMALWDILAKGDLIELAVMEPVKLIPYTDGGISESICKAPKRVSIFGERLRRREHETLMLFTTDETNAMLLRADFLPGQRGEMRNRERGAFASGFLRALQAFGA